MNCKICELPMTDIGYEKVYGDYFAIYFCRYCNRAVKKQIGEVLLVR